MPKKVGGLQQLLVEDLQDLFDAEKQLVRALPKIAKSARDDELENLLRGHLETTKTQVQRLEQIFRSMEMPARSKPCKGMRGIVEEGQEMLAEEHEGGILDSAIAGSSRKVEHYEIASYETARSLAQQLGFKEAVQLLEETLAEEVQTDRNLAQISKRLLKTTSSASAMGEEGAREGKRSSGRSGSRQASGRPPRAQSVRSRSASGRSTSRSAGSRSGGRGGHRAEPLTDHDQIRQWAEQRGARPACVRGTGGGEDTGMIRLDFPGYSGGDSLTEISWDDWFEKFDENNLALLVQETTSGGQKSNFNRIISRETAQSRQRPKARAAR